MKFAWYVLLVVVAALSGMVMALITSWPSANPSPVTVSVYVPQVPTPLEIESNRINSDYVHGRAVKLSLNQWQKEEMTSAELTVGEPPFAPQCPCLFYLGRARSGMTVYSVIPVIDVLPRRFPLLARVYGWNSPRLDFNNAMLTVDQEVSWPLLVLNLVVGLKVGFFIGLVLFFVGYVLTSRSWRQQGVKEIKERSS